VTDRRFGVEIEFDSNGLGTSGVTRLLRETFDRHNLRRWYFRDRLYYDGSELELATPILRGANGFKQLEVVMDTLQNAGCYVTGDDGLHIHHDAPEFTHNIENCIRLVKSWNANRHIICQFVDSERVEYWACPKWTDEDIQQLEEDKEIPMWERNDLNLNSLNKHGSIEIRLHEGTLDFEEARSWILFGQRFIDRVLKYSMRESKDATNLLKKVRVSANAEKFLLNKARWSNPIIP